MFRDYFTPPLPYIEKTISDIPDCLQLAAILLDSTNLSSSSCSFKDKYMATMLIHGAGRFGCNGLYQLCMYFVLHLHILFVSTFFSSLVHFQSSYCFLDSVRYKMYDVTGLKVADVLRKDFKKWTRVGMNLK